MSARSLKNSSIRGSQEVASAITVSGTAPEGPKNGDQWFDTATGKTFIWYVDVDGGQWVDFGTGAGPQGPQGAAGANGTFINASTTAPTAGDGSDGDLWIVYS